MMLGLGQDWSLAYKATPEDIAQLNAYVNALDAQAALEAGTGTDRPAGPSLPPGFVSKPFNCPEGSDYAASQKVGMCVAADYSPVYSQSVPGGAKTYYNLDGSVAGVEQGTACPPGTIIPCVRDVYLYLGAGFLLLLMMRRRGR